MTVTIYEGDCRDYISKVKADLIIMDPPYDIKSNRGGGFGNLRQKFYSGLDALSEGLSDAVLKDCLSMTPNVYVWGNWRAIRGYLDVVKEYNTNLLSWHKSNPIPTCSNKYLTDTEYCLFIRGKGVKVYGGFADHHTYWITPLNTKDKKLYNHPTIKPVDIIRTMIRNSCPPGGTVFDPFMGSGTTGVAAVLEGRDFIGCEIDHNYCQTARARIKAAEIDIEQILNICE